jgi:hypothetical protein
MKDSENSVAKELLPDVPYVSPTGYEYIPTPMKLREALGW